MKLLTGTFAAAGFVCLSLMPADAATVSYTISGANISGDITFDLGSLNGPAYGVSGVSGEINGEAISGPVCYEGSCNGGEVIYQSSPGLFGAWSIVNNFGFSLDFANGVDIQFNPDSDPHYLVSESSNGFLYNDTFTLTPISATPLPATWTLMLMGLTGLGFAAYRQQKQNMRMAVV
jgi:hypothetical protein